MFPIPITHGMTIGELAGMYNGEGWLANRIKCKITVIPVKAGLRVYPVKSIFLTGNAGVGFLKDEVMSSRESRFMYDAGIGFHFFLPQISVHYEAWKKQSSPGYTTAVLLKMGFALK